MATASYGRPREQEAATTTTKPATTRPPRTTPSSSFSTSRWVVGPVWAECARRAVAESGGGRRERRPPGLFGDFPDDQHQCCNVIARGQHPRPPGWPRAPTTRQTAVMATRPSRTTLATSVAPDAPSPPAHRDTAASGQRSLAPHPCCEAPVPLGAFSWAHGKSSVLLRLAGCCRGGAGDLARRDVQRVRQGEDV